MVGFLDRRANQCAFPLWQTADEPRFVCGAPVKTLRQPYCACHRRVMFGPGTPSEQAAIRNARSLAAREVAG